MEPNPLQYLLPVVFVVAVVGGSWWWQMRKVAKAGGHGAAWTQAQGLEYGLFTGEQILMMPYVAETYFGPLVPGSDADVPTGFAGALEKLDGTTYRGYVLHVAVTSHRRLVISKEGKCGPQSQVVYDMGYRPLFSFAPDQLRPRLLSPGEAFPGHPALGHALDGPSRHNSMGAVEKLSLAQLLMPDGRRYTFWCEQAGLRHIHAWCMGQA